jgi:hypothetical protein
MESKKCAGNGGVVWLSFVLLALFSIACSGTDNSSDGITKEDAKKMGKADWTEDYCLENEWYWDGVCDPFCQKMDPDCKVNECIESCGVGCPAPEHWICGDDGQLYCNNCYMACYGASPANDPSTCEQGPSPEKCLEACGMGCPAPEYWICGEDGQLYCNECYMACYGVSPSDDPSTCEQGGDPTECMEACGAGCPAPAYWICGDDGQYYCNECYMACYGVSKAQDSALCDQAVHYCISDDDCQAGMVCTDGICT